MALITPARLHWTYAFTTLFGIGTAVTTVIPGRCLTGEYTRTPANFDICTVVALALSVPSFLLGAAGTLSISCRALGGIIGITIFTAIHNNKLASNLPKDVGQALLETTHTSPASLKGLLGEVLGALSNTAIPPPESLAKIQPALSKPTIGAVLGALTKAESDSWKWVWVAVSALVALNALVACFARPVSDKMNHHIESALESSEARDRQMAGKI